MEVRQQESRGSVLALDSEDRTMSALYSGLPAATSVQQSIILAQLELLRRLDPARVEAAKEVLLHN